MRWQDMPRSTGIEAGDIGPAARDAAARSLDPSDRIDAVMARIADLHSRPLTPEQHAWTQANLPSPLPTGPLEDPAQAQNFDP